jgi:hypothetical protein
MVRNLPLSRMQFFMVEPRFDPENLLTEKLRKPRLMLRVGPGETSAESSGNRNHLTPRTPRAQRQPTLSITVTIPGRPSAVEATFSAPAGSPFKNVAANVSRL